MLAPWKKSYDQPKQHIKKQSHYLSTKVHLVKAMVFLVVIYGFLTYKESWVPKNWCFWTVVLEKTLESPWTARRSNQSILKEISLECSLEGLVLKMKCQYCGHLMWRADSFEKNPDAGKDLSKEEKGTTKDEMVGWHHQLNGHDFG